MTRICHIIKATRLSGAERHLLILLPALRARGMDTHLILLTEPNNPMDNIVQIAKEAGVIVTQLTIRRGLDLTIVPRLRTQIALIQPDIVHTHLIHADVFGLIAARQAGVKRVITTRHNDDAFRRRLPIRLLNRWNWRGVSAGIAISASLGNFVRQIESAPAHKLHVIQYGLQNQRPSALDIELMRRQLRLDLNLLYDTQLVGVVSRLIEQKGVTYALAGFKAIAQEFPDAYLIVIGDGDQRPALEAQAYASGIAERVRFMGWREDAATLMRGLDMMLMPSLWEGFGITLLEAMSARIPIIASHVSAIPEVVVHGETGYLVAPRDADAIAYALRLLLADPQLCKYLGQNGEDRLESLFSADRMADETLALYQTVLKQP